MPIPTKSFRRDEVERSLPNDCYCALCAAKSYKLARGTDSVLAPIPKDSEQAQQELPPVTFDLRPWTEVSIEVGPEVEWLVDRLLPKGGLSIIGAPPKCGKSTAARCLAAVVAGVGSGEWMGRRVRTGRVLYFSLEGPPSVVIQHVNQLRPPAEELVLATQLQAMPPVEARVAALAHAVHTHRPELVVIDTLERFLEVKDLTNYAEVSQAFQPLIDLATRESLHCMFVHHTVKAMPGVFRRHGSELLGSQCLIGSVDTVLIMKWTDGEQREIYSENRAGTPLPPTVLSLSEDGWLHSVGERAKMELARLQGRVLGHLTESDAWIALSQIKRDIEGRPKCIVEALDRLVEAGTVRREKRGEEVYFATEGYCSVSR